MGEFSAQWLSLREPVDHAARSEPVRQALLTDLAKRHGSSLTGLRVLDMGCGSGSNLRALAPALGDQQHWVLVDYDDALLAAARQALLGWAERVIRADDTGVVLQHTGLTVSVTFERADLVAAMAPVLARPVDLITASALFDLVSEPWVDRLVAQLNAPLYAVLSFDGEMTWRPAHPDDQRVSRAFARHQQQDKGFGPALGPRSGLYLAQALTQAGYRVVSDKSPWLIDTLPSPFHDMLVQGIASAAADTGDVCAAAVDDWLQSRRVAQCCVIGHDDLYAFKP